MHRRMTERVQSWSTKWDAEDTEAQPAGRARWSSRRPAGGMRGSADRTRWSAVRSWVALGAAAALVVFTQFAGGVAPTSADWVLRPSMPLAADADAPRPSRQAAESPEPLGVPVITAAGGPHDFALRQPYSDDPVAYDPCRTIRYVVNERTMPPGAQMLVRDAVETVGKATGLRFVFEGATDEIVVAQRSPFQHDRYGDRWAPVLIAWSDPTELPDLAGDVAGLGGSRAVLPARDGPAVYVTGLVALDGPQIRDMYRSVGGRLAAKGVVLHELGHLVGLGHVDDPSQLMHGSSGTVDLQPGDLEGLARLGGGACLPLL